MYNEPKRRWRAGDRGVEDGIPWRISPGAKRDGDLVLEVFASGRWRKMRMHTLMLFVDILGENEDVLYPPPQLGGEKLIRGLRMAWQFGCKRAQEKLDEEIRAARDRRNRRDDSQFPLF